MKEFNREEKVQSLASKILDRIMNETGLNKLRVKLPWYISLFTSHIYRFWEDVPSFRLGKYNNTLDKITYYGRHEYYYGWKGPFSNNQNAYVNARWREFKKNFYLQLSLSSSRAISKVIDSTPIYWKGVR